MEKSCDIKAEDSLILVPMISPFHLKHIVSDARVLTMATVCFQERLKIGQRRSPSDAVPLHIDRRKHTHTHTISFIILASRQKMIPFRIIFYATKYSWCKSRDDVLANVRKCDKRIRTEAALARKKCFI